MHRIYQHNSTAFHLNAARRHIRLSRKQKGVQNFAERITPKQQKLVETQRFSTLADEKHEDAYNDIFFADLTLDGTIHSKFETSILRDRSNPREQVLLKLLPFATFTKIINIPYAKETLETKSIAADISKRNAFNNSIMAILGFRMLS